MLKGETVKVVIIGGSVTYGADLPNRMEQRWSNYFNDIMNSGWYSGKFDVDNKGAGACNVDVWMYKLDLIKDADLVIVDLSVNDQGFELQALPHLYRSLVQLMDSMPNHPAIMFQQAFRTGNRDRHELDVHCPDPTQQGTCCNGFVYCKRWWDMQDFVAITLEKFGVPRVSYRDLAWPEFSNPPPVLDAWWNGMSHPDARAHMMMGKLMAYAVAMQIKDAHHQHLEEAQCALGQPLGTYVSSQNMDDTIRPICGVDPLAKLTAGETPDSGNAFPATTLDGRPVALSTFASPADEESPWRYFNDSQLKFGWILDVSKSQVAKRCHDDSSNKKWCGRAIDHSTISFKVKLSAAPRIQITFLKSHGDSMGAVSVWLDDRRDQVLRVPGYWTEQPVEYSVAHTLTLSPQPLVNMSALVVGDAAVLPALAEGEHMLHFSLPPTEHDKDQFKWKLLGITAC
jgi:hypothetical protein